MAEKKERKERKSKLEVLKSKIPAEYHHLLANAQKLELITQLSKLDASTLAMVIKSVPEDILPIFKIKLEGKKAAARGAKSAIPYGSDDISKASKLMKMKVGTVVKDCEGTEYSLSTVQILIKAKDADGKVSTISLSKMAD